MKHNHNKDKSRLKPPQSVSATGSTNNESPLFCLKYLTGRYCLTNCQKDDQAAFALALHTLSQTTWQVIQTTHRHGLGQEKISRDSIQAVLPPHITPDVQILAIRFHGKKPMLGYRNGRVFHVLHLDHDFTAYQH